MTLTDERISILRHTMANGRYCGDSSDMQELVSGGLMRSLGKTAWCPDEFFAITREGRSMLQQIEVKP